MDTMGNCDLGITSSISKGTVLLEMCCLWKWNLFIAWGGNHTGIQVWKEEVYWLRFIVEAKWKDYSGFSSYVFSQFVPLGGNIALSSSSLEQRPGSRNSVPFVQFSLCPHLASLAFVSGGIWAGVLHYCTQAPLGAYICSMYSCQTPGGCKVCISATKREWAKEGLDYEGCKVEVRDGRKLCLTWVILSGA